MRLSNANRDYAIVYDIKNGSLVLSRPLNFYITDKNTSNIFVKLVTRIIVGNGIDQYVDIENASNYVLTMRVVKPSNEVKSIEATQHESESIFQFDLTENFKDVPGKYICELMISTIVNGKQELTTSDPFSYEVKRSVLSEVGEIIETEDITTEKLLGNLGEIKAELSSEIKKKADKDEVFTMANMGQDIKEAMTGGSVAVVGNQMVGHANLSKQIQNEIGYYETVTGYTGESYGYGINGSNVAYLHESGGAGNTHVDFNVVSGDVYRINITTAGTGSIKSVIFTDNDLKVKGSISMTSTITNEVYDVCVPTGATKMLVSYRSGKTTLIQKMNYYKLATKHDLAIVDNITENDLKILNDLKKQLATYEEVQYTETSYGYAIKNNKPYLYEKGGAGNSNAVISVTKNDAYKIEMTTSGTGSTKSIILTDVNNNVIRYTDLTNTIAKETYNVEIPENVTKMYVSFRRGLCKIYKATFKEININTGEGGVPAEGQQVPGFYKEHMANKIKTIQQLEMAHGGNGCTFAIITDIHWGSNKKYSPALVKEVMENTNCKFVINNGDSAFSSRGPHNTKENGVADLNAVRKLFNNATNNNFYCVRGNHDNNSTGSPDDNPDYLLSENEMYSLLVEKYDHKIVGDINNPTGLYYYFDDNKNKIRHIILDSFEDGQVEGVMSVKQMKWFCEKAVQFNENGWNICLYTHKPVSPFETSLFAEVRGILRAIRYGSQYSATYTDNNSETYDINVSFAGKGHTVMFVANGHAHFDTLKQDNNITYFKSVCDAGYINAVEITDRNGINSQSFDVVCINKNTKQINLVRIGCGNDRIFTYGENSTIIQNTDMTKK